jgi:hypothetical protein
MTSVPDRSLQEEVRSTIRTAVDVLIRSMARLIAA